MDLTESRDIARILVRELGLDDSAIFRPEIDENLASTEALKQEVIKLSEQALSIESNKAGFNQEVKGNQPLKSKNFITEEIEITKGMKKHSRKKMYLNS